MLYSKPLLLIYFIYSSVHLQKAMATHSSTLAWKVPWTEEPGGLQFMGSQRVGHDWRDFACMHYSLRSALYLCWHFSFSVPGLVSWVVLGFPIKSNVHFLRASWSQFAEVKCGSYSRAQMSCLPGYQVALTSSEITDVVCACVYKEIFFHWKNMKKNHWKV